MWVGGGGWWSGGGFSIFAILVCGGVRGRVGDGVWFPCGNDVCGVCVRGVWLKDRVRGGDWLLYSRCTCGVSVCGGVGVREGVCVCCVVWVLRGALFGVHVEVSEGPLCM